MHASCKFTWRAAVLQLLRIDAAMAGASTCQKQHRVSEAVRREPGHNAVLTQVRIGDKMASFTTGNYTTSAA